MAQTDWKTANMEPKKPFTARAVAEWMTEQLENFGRLQQNMGASDILDKFGEKFVHKTDLGNLSIDSRVLEEFHTLNPDIIYERWSWRKRDEWDPPRKARKPPSR